MCAVGAPFPLGIMGRTYRARLRLHESRPNQASNWPQEAGAWLDGGHGPPRRVLGKSLGSRSSRRRKCPGAGTPQLIFGVVPGPPITDSKDINGEGFGVHPYCLMADRS